MVYLPDFHQQNVEVTFDDGRIAFGRVWSSSTSHNKIWWDPAIFMPNCAIPVFVHEYNTSSPPDIKRITLAKRTLINWITHRRPTKEDGATPSNIPRTGDELSRVARLNHNQGINSAWGITNWANVQSGQNLSAPWAHLPEWKPPAPKPKDPQPLNEVETALVHWIQGKLSDADKEALLQQLQSS